jgi:hypothetical protein
MQTGPIVSFFHRLKGRIEEMEQYSRRQIVRILGIPESEDENTDVIVLDIARRIGLELQNGTFPGATE